MQADQAHHPAFKRGDLRDYPQAECREGVYYVNAIEHLVVEMLDQEPVDRLRSYATIVVLAQRIEHVCHEALKMSVSGQNAREALAAVIQISEQISGIAPLEGEALAAVEKIRAKLDCPLRSLFATGQ